MAAAEVTAAYRSLLRAARKAFPGDKQMVDGAKSEIRHKFEENRGVTSPEEVAKLIGVAREGSEFLSTMVVQAPLNSSGNYELKTEKTFAGQTLEIPTDECVKAK